MSHEPLIRTAARWRIPRDLALEVLARDLRCIYCGRGFENLSGPRAGLPSWEHIVNDESIVNAMNIALCCVGCNSSKGTKALEKWLESKYCKVRSIASSTIAPVAASALGASEKIASHSVDGDFASPQLHQHFRKGTDTSPL
ncbi:HNH endonuclease [Polaromonas sp. P1(28)-13]|nr:HNH endonuclease [Polaromonas sp. P1(28)-13]